MKAIVILICFLFLQSCVEQQKPNLVNQSTIVLMPVHLMDTIQHFFNNDNWRVVMNGKDTFYQYFSRQNDLLIHVYQFKMHQGDSIQSSLQKITCTPKGIFWEQMLDTFQLKMATQQNLLWISESDTLSFKHIQPALLQLQYENTVAIMQPTINLTDFLIRSRYDFIHGTHFANDTAKFKRSIYKPKK